MAGVNMVLVAGEAGGSKWRRSEGRDRGGKGRSGASRNYQHPLVLLLLVPTQSISTQLTTELVQVCRRPIPFRLLPVQSNFPFSAGRCRACTVEGAHRNDQGDLQWNLDAPDKHTESSSVVSVVFSLYRTLKSVVKLQATLFELQATSGMRQRRPHASPCLARASEVVKALSSDLLLPLFSLSAYLLRYCFPVPSLSAH